MSNQEAIALLRNLEDALDSYCELNEEGKTAFRMAIEALSCSENPNNSDCISRQAAIEAMSESLKRVFPEHRQIAEKCLNVLPSAQEKPFNLPEIYIAEGYDTIEGEDGNVGFGVYVPGKNQIYVAGDVEDEIRARALLHEVCHWVQDMCGRPFDEDEANEFSDIVYDALPSAQETHEERTETHACDLIDREAAIDVADAVWSVTGDKNVAKVWDQIKNLPSAQPEPQWIPWNSGRFPKESGTYTVTAYDGATKRVTYAKYQKRLKRWELTGARAYWRVLAWMPLPEPYKAESDETPTLMSEKQYCDNDREAVYEAYEKSKESALKESVKVNRYYSILRPVSLGTFPGRIHVTKIHNFEYRTRVEEIQYVAWGYFETPDKLTEQECYEYDLVEGAKHENMG